MNPHPSGLQQSASTKPAKNLIRNSVSLMHYFTHLKCVGYKYSVNVRQVARLHISGQGTLLLRK
jgi:hypothetical protein